MKKYHQTFGLFAALAVALSLPALAQEQNADHKKEGEKPQQHGGQAVVHQNAPQHHTAASPQQQVSHQAAPQQQQAVHHAASQQRMSQESAPQQQATRAVSQSANIQNVSRHQATAQNGASGYHHKNQSQNSSQQTSSASVQALNQPANSQSVQSGNGERHLHGNQAQTSNQQVANGTVNNAQQPTQSYNNSGGGHQSRQQPQVAPNGQYNSGNNYGGYWSSGDTHRDWNHNGQHNWNNNNYVWYQGGWLIVNSFFNPFYVNSGYANNGYYRNGALVSQVQTSLANLGYYNGPIDGAAGPGTRNAIASYQSNQNLNVTGHINGDLLQSLQIQ